MSLRYLSVCSGIEAASVAWHPLGWQAAGFSEIDRFPAALLENYYPAVRNFGDLTKHETWNPGPIDLLVGGTPCQSFSIAGLRSGMDDQRGQLALEFFRLAARLRPRWIVWENVPGVLSSNAGRDFGSIVGALAELGYGYAYRVLDAQYFGVAQRRRRVFVVGHSGGSWQRAAAVLFERESVRGDPAPSSEAREKAARDLGVGVARCVGTRRREQPSQETMIPVAFSNTAGNTALAVSVNSSPPITCRNGDPGMIFCATGEKAHALTSEGFDASEDGTGRGAPIVATLRRVRRLTPLECERLQGFPDGYTAIPYKGKPANDGPRYKALGNSMAVLVMRWIGERIQAVEQIGSGS